MAYCKINKTGCCERKGNLQVRFDFFLEKDDPRYEDCYVQVVDTSSKEYLAGYTGKVDKEGLPLKQADYDAWYNSLPKVYQLNPFHSHFAYFDPDVTDEEIKAEMNYHLPNFYKAYQDGWDKVQGGMRHGFAVEKRLGCLDYKELDTPENYLIRKSQVINRLNRLDEFKYTPIKLDDGKSYPATTIDVGSPAIARTLGFDVGNTTRLDLNNPANDTGTLDTFEIWAERQITGTKVGTFSGSGANWTSRDYASIGTVTAGSKQTFTGQDVDVEEDDVVGIVGTTQGAISTDLSGGTTGIAYTSGDKFDGTEYTYTVLASRVHSLYAKGETLPEDVTVTPTTLSLTTTPYAPTVTKTDNKTTTPTTLSLSITSYAPTVTKTENKTATPSTLSLTITTYAPSIVVTGNKTVTPTTATLTITTYAPIAGYDIDLIPTTLSLSITTYVPTVTISASKSVEPSTLELAITGYAPTITIREIPASALKYTLEVRNSSGTLVSILENAYDRVYTQKINEPQQLTFSIPADDDKVSGLVKPNQIWLRDYSTGTLIRKFVITRLVKKDSGNCTYQVECKGYLSKLLKAVVQSYAPSGKTPTEILTALLTYQTLDTITLGTVDITGTYSFSWSNTTVLACLNDCLTAWGGFFDVDNDNVLTWLDDIGSDVGQQIRYRKNLVTVEVETDYEGQNSRIYATGNSLRLPDYKPSFDPVTQSSDASFGYLTLQDYKCYVNWTGDGDALPYGVGYDITVYRVSSEFSISFFSCSGTGWTDPANAIDGNVVTSAERTPGTDWTGYLVAAAMYAVLCTGLRWYIWGSAIDDIEIQYSPDGTTWTTVVSAWDPAWQGAWGQYDFAEPTLVKYMRLRTHYGYVYVYEMEMRSTYADDTSKFVQGANEQIVKCAIGDYHAGDTYYLGYTHAFYIKDFTAAATYGDEAINATFNYAGDAETLLKYAQAQMELIKNPPKYYQSGIILLNEVDANFSFEELDLGNIVKIIHEPLNVDDSVRIVAMTQDLDNPANGSIEIQTKIRSLADSFRALWARI